MLCSILQKAATALEVLREVLDAVDSQHPEGAKDEFTLDLVEQCSFQKQRVMHLAISSRDKQREHIKMHLRKEAYVSDTVTD
ncbi:hypothetical protein FXO38_23157 [Capsicum annuum]|nr:hypothetical protein FXO37_29335 [Capsicum annuum]KAF3638619.1 hypothetical protein FXO38_23157 [Capsicum annuum]